MTAAQDRALEAVRARAADADAAVPGAPALTINLHPDRLDRRGRPVLEALVADGEVHNQFVTGISAGGLDSVMRGARTRWEQAMFGDAYDHADPHERPRYAGLSLVRDTWGACPRFGSGHLRLRPELLERTTFTWGDSVTDPTAAGVWGRMGAVLRAAQADGWSELTGAPRRAADLLDTYVEAQVHAPVRLAGDVEALVLDESFRGSTVEQVAGAAATSCGFALEWAPARSLDPDALDPAFRTELTPRLAREVHARLARPGQPLDAELVGRAAQEVVRSRGEGWQAYGDVGQTLQEVKYLWHHLVRFGTPGTDR